jgi:glutamyl-tRNA synthetase
MKPVRVRFAPSPTGALHIGGVRTALYNYLLARKLGGTYILRIEDTDQNRYVKGAEDYIIESLNWLSLPPDEGPGFGGDYGPYRQSERKDLYGQYADQLVQNGHAYYAFDTPEELDARRQQEKEKGNHSFKYGARVRMEMRNSLTLSNEETKRLLEEGHPYTIRLKVPTDETVRVDDLVRGAVDFQTKELDDKVMLKADGMPTYHLANVVDDYLMKISHVVRGEEWLPSTAHHVLLYRAFGWEDVMPEFSHLPLILKPTGKGKLSKRDGAKLGMPVFPLSWKGETPADSFEGFREFGFDPKAVVNFLAFLGWNPGTEQELFSLEELCDAFSVERIGKAGARFDYDKAKWFNQQYIMASDEQELAPAVRPYIEAHGHQPSDGFLQEFIGLMKERVTVYPDFWTNGYYFFEPVRDYDEKTARKKWKPERRSQFEQLHDQLQALDDYSAEQVEAAVKSFMEQNELKFGDVLPILRIAVSGTTKGPGVFEMMALIGKEEVGNRLQTAFAFFETL